MKWIVHDGSGQLRVEGEGMRAPREERGTANPWAGGKLADRAVHELLFDAAAGEYAPGFLAMLATAEVQRGEIIWVDPFRLVYPPALESLGLQRVTIVRPPAKDAVWTVAECLGCSAVGTVIGNVPAKMSRVETRRLQLAAERSGAMGLMLRPWGKGAEVYAAATRWRVSPAPPAQGGTQAWKVELIHGQGRLGQTFFVERCRAVPIGYIPENLPVYLSAPLARRATVPASAQLGA